MATGALEKVRIFAYLDKTMRNKSPKGPNPFILPVNPETYSKNFKVELDSRRGHGNQGTDSRFTSTAPEELQLEFLFDGTETIEGYHYNDAKDKSVKRQLEQFLNTVYKMEGDIHRPHFLEVHWGKYLKFPCVLTNLDITYQLFETSGDPLRIKIRATFLNYIAQEERAARQRQNSPDLTHTRLAKAGDRLDLMTHSIYNDAKYILQVAKANNLVSIRNLKPGRELRFPPLDKSEEA